MDLDRDIARTILEGFDKHYRLFREGSAGAKDRFERAAWGEVRDAHATRIAFYDTRVREGVALLRERFPTACAEESRWPRIKQAYIQLLYDHKQPECAETFYNSVACRVLDRRYYVNDYIFWRPAVSTEYLDGDPATYRTYHDPQADLRDLFGRVVRDLEFRNEWQDLERDLDFLEVTARSYFGGVRRPTGKTTPPPSPQPASQEPLFPAGLSGIHNTWTRQANFQVQVLTSPFYRNKAAYVVGKVLNGNAQIPFVVPILQDEQGRLFLDALLLSPVDIGRTFSLARAYFMVDTEVPAATVRFLRTLMPNKPKAELYTLLGLQKQGKTNFYRDLHAHLSHSTDQFEIAPGVKGMVMVVFTLPSFPYVIKIIRDWFPPPKDTDRDRVMDRYHLVKRHDRVGRMADTLEYSHVAFPLSRISAELRAELEALVPSQITIDESRDRLVVSHLYIERRMVPLDMYLADAEPERARAAIVEYGNAIKELCAANIFPGDLLTKNFGVTRFGRVVFYDYDELDHLTAFKFRRMPTPRHHDEEMAAEPYFAVGPTDVFPEQFPTFMFGNPAQRAYFMEVHGDLADPRYWIEEQDKHRHGEVGEFFPYAPDVRFNRV